MLSVDFLTLCISSTSHCFIHQLVLFCQHGITIHGPVWYYPFEVGHFHYMMDEHISECSSFVTFHISVCSLSYTRAYPHSLGSSDISQASFTFLI